MAAKSGSSTSIATAGERSASALASSVPAGSARSSSATDARRRRNCSCSALSVGDSRLSEAQRAYSSGRQPSWRATTSSSRRATRALVSSISDAASPCGRVRSSNSPR